MNESQFVFDVWASLARVTNISFYMTPCQNILNGKIELGVRQGVGRVRNSTRLFSRWGTRIQRGQRVRLQRWGGTSEYHHPFRM